MENKICSCYKVNPWWVETAKGKGKIYKKVINLVLLNKVLLALCLRNKLISFEIAWHQV